MSDFRPKSFSEDDQVGSKGLVKLEPFEIERFKQ
jgi:hypothetical protein